MKTTPMHMPLVLTASRLETIANKYVFNPMGLSAVTMRIMRVLDCYPSMTPGQILKSIGGSKSNISQRLAFLEKKKYIERSYADDDHDKRKVTVTLTQEGKKKMEEAARRLAIGQVELERHFTEAELNNYYAFFEKINQIIDEKEGQLGIIFNSKNSR